MKLTKNYILEGRCVSKDSTITILNEEEFNQFLFDSNGNPISKEDVDVATDRMLKSFESDTAFMQTNFGDLNVKNEMRKYIMSQLTQSGDYPNKDVCLEYILTINARNI